MLFVEHGKICIYDSVIYLIVVYIGIPCEQQLSNFNIDGLLGFRHGHWNIQPQIPFS